MKTDRIQFFPTDFKAWRRSACRNITLLTVPYIVMCGYFWLDSPGVVPAWLEVTIVLIYAAWLIFELVSYLHGKRFVLESPFYLSRTGIGFFDMGLTRELPYTDLRIVKVERRGNDVTAIHLKARYGFGQIVLAGMYDMKGLYEHLSKTVKHDE